jgi:glycosyltransferase involved in cell wall biosynthesis
MLLNTRIFNNKVCLVVDIYNWAFHNIAKKLKENLEKNNNKTTVFSYIDFEKKMYSNNFKIGNFKHFIFFWYPSNTNFLRKIKKVDKKIKISRLIYDNFSYKYVNFDNVDNILVSSPKILTNFKDFYKNTPNGYCIDGVDEKLFQYFGYKSKDKLIVGWIGNSDPKINGINKGFKEIKETMYDLSDNFIFTPLDKMDGYIPHEQVPNYIKNIDIIVCFSKTEGTPNQILEASSCGKTWVSTDVGIVSLLDSSIPNNKCGLIIKRNKEDLKEKLNHFNENRHLLEEYGKNGRRAILKNFTWDKRVNSILKCLNI